MRSPSDRRDEQIEFDFDHALERYRGGVWRDRILYDLILRDARKCASELTFLDIGCGRGFDGNTSFQRSLAASGRKYIGVEPDRRMRPAEHFSQFYDCKLEDVPLAAGSVDIAFAIMVLEHLADPRPFVAKLFELLSDGGIFWGLTVDERHWFAKASLLAERTHLKEIYLNAGFGKRGVDRYENYPVYYRFNSPAQIRPFTSSFRRCDFLSLSRPDQSAGLLPQRLRPFGRLLTRPFFRPNAPGTMLLVRLEK